MSNPNFPPLEKYRQVSNWRKFVKGVTKFWKALECDFRFTKTTKTFRLKT